MLLLVFITTLVAYSFLACSYVGLGLLAFRSVAGKLPLSENLFLFLWTGWSVSLFFLQAWNFFAPISAYTSILLFGFGFLAFAWFTGKQVREIRKNLPSPVFLFLLFVIAVWLGARSMQKSVIWDSGLYHFSSIRWLNEYAIVPGLGNLHGRLAFNQSFFAYVASLNLQPWFNHGHNLAISFLLLVALAECLAYLWRVVGNNKRALTDVIAVFFILPLAYFATTINLSSPSPNTASAILQILLFVYFAREVEGNFRDDNARNANFAFILILSATAVTVKLSNLFFVAAICFVIYLLKFQSLKTALKEKLSTLLYFAIPPFLILLIWVGRGFILSGCPVFPSTVGCVDVKWAVPLPSVQLEADRTYRFSRYQLESVEEKPLESWKWVVPWFERVILGNKISVLYPVYVFISVALALVLFFTFTPVGKVPKTKKEYFLIPLPVLIGIISWFCIAPDLRFAYGLFWILPVSIVYVLLKILDTHQNARAIGLVFFFITNASIVFFFVQSPQVLKKISFHGYKPIQTSVLILKTTRTGLEVWMPEAKVDTCWDSPLPCVRDFNPELQLIGDDIQSGFMVATPDR